MRRLSREVALVTVVALALLAPAAARAGWTAPEVTHSTNVGDFGLIAVNEGSFALKTASGYQTSSLLNRVNGTWAPEHLIPNNWLGVYRTNWLRGNGRGTGAFVDNPAWSDPVGTVQTSVQTAGGPWGAAENASAGGLFPYDVLPPVVGADGSVTAFWDHYVAADDRTSIWARTRSASGTWGTPELAATGGANFGGGDTAIDGEGRIYVSFLVPASYPEVASFRLTVRDPTTGHWSAPESFPSGPRTGGLRGLPNGGMAVPSLTRNAAFNDDLSLLERDPDGGWSSHLVASDIGAGSYVDLAVGANGALALAWRNASNWNTTNETFSIRVARRLASGEWQPTERLTEEVNPRTTVHNGVGEPRVAVGPGGGVRVLWTRTWYVPGCCEWSRVETRMHPSVGSWGLVQYPSRDGFSRLPEIAIDSAGTALVVWQTSMSTLGGYVIASGTDGTAPDEATVSVSKTGTGSGTVTSTPAGITCGADCTETYTNGPDPVTLVATPASDSVFTGWSGSCHGTGTCSVPLWTDPQSVTAAFAHIPPPIATTGTATNLYYFAQAVLYATVDANGFATTHYFEYGTTAAYGAKTPTVTGPSPSSAGAQPVLAGLDGLAAATTYHYRIVATNAGGTAAGADAMFTTRTSVTPPPPPPPPAPRPPPPPAIKCHVPVAKGQPLRIARVRIRAAHCSVGKVRYIRSTKRRGLVLWQSPRKGTTLPRGGRVNLIVSRGRRG